MTTYFLYDGDQLFLELDSTGNTVAQYGWSADGLRTRYDLATNRSCPPTSTTQKVTSPSGSQHIRSETLRSAGSTPAPTTRSASCRLTAAPILATSPDPHDPVGFGGQYGYYTDRDTGLVLCTHRYYDPVRGR
ncbi:MAG TPA: hypothetical protein VGK19_09710 [Capsulimonadaceae bacterium]